MEYVERVTEYDPESGLTHDLRVVIRFRPTYFDSSGTFATPSQTLSARSVHQQILERTGDTFLADAPAYPDRLSEDAHPQFLEHPRSVDKIL